MENRSEVSQSDDHLRDELISTMSSAHDIIGYLVRSYTMVTGQKKGPIRQELAQRASMAMLQRSGKLPLNQQHIERATANTIRLTRSYMEERYCIKLFFLASLRLSPRIAM
jgi:hypothetical protein